MNSLTAKLFWGLRVWMQSIGRSRHPEPEIPHHTPHVSVGFLDLGVWLSHNDLALVSEAQFLAVADHLLFARSRARNATVSLWHGLPPARISLLEGIAGVRRGEGAERERELACVALRFRWPYPPLPSLPFGSSFG